MSIVKRTCLIVVISLLCAGCDQVTKSIAQDALSQGKTVSYLGDSVRLQLAHNSGAFLSLGASLPDSWRNALFVIGAGGLLFAVLLYALTLKSDSFSPILSLALILAGGLSNLFDRIVGTGQVVDFINIGIGSLRTGIFNVADMAILAGVLIFVTSNIGNRKKE